MRLIKQTNMFRLFLREHIEVNSYLIICQGLKKKNIKKNMVKTKCLFFFILPCHLA